MARQSATRLLGAHAKAGVWPETRDDRPMENKQLQSTGIDCKVGTAYPSIKADLNPNIGIIFLLSPFTAI